MNDICNFIELYIFFFVYYNHISFAKCDDTSVI